MTRAAFFRLHSWLGIVTGVFLLVIAGSGSLVVFNDEIEWLVNPAARADPAQGVRPIDDVAAAIQARHPDRRFAIHLQIGPRWAHIAYVYDGRSQRLLLVDPATAAIRSDQLMDGYTFNTGYFLRQLHVRLLMGYWGRVFVGLFGVTLVLSVLTSLWIYREWLRSLVRLRRDHGRRIFHMDLHKAVGLWTLAFNLHVRRHRRRAGTGEPVLPFPAAGPAGSGGVRGGAGPGDADHAGRSGGASHRT